MLKREKTLVIIAGPNGSGKSTFHACLEELKALPFINADNIAKERFASIGAKESEEAQVIAATNIERFLSVGQSFCFETVFSHPSKLDLIRSAKLLDYRVILIVVSPGISALNILRVKQRVAEGGHHVPVDKILSRIPKTMANLKDALLLVDAYQIVDSSENSSFKLLAHKPFGGQVEVLEKLPDWALAILSDHNVTLVTGCESHVGGVSKQIQTFAKNLFNRERETCKKCQRPLRGKFRRKYGVCSTCEPRLGGLR
jgi:predicted ABC-type ATPase